MSIKRIKILSITALILVGFITFTLMYIDLSYSKLPDNKLYHKSYVIKDVGDYHAVYTNMMISDTSDQHFELSTYKQGNDLYVYTLAHSTTVDEQERFGKWLLSFYGAEVTYETN